MGKKKKKSTKNNPTKDAILGIITIIIISAVLAFLFGGDQEDFLKRFLEGIGNYFIGTITILTVKIQGLGIIVTFGLGVGGVILIIRRMKKQER